MADFSFDRHAFWAGFRDIVPLAVPGIPFGFVLGVVIAESGLDRFVAWLSSPIVLAGAPSWPPSNSSPSPRAPPSSS